MALWSWANLQWFSATTVNNIERDNFTSCRTIDRMNEEIEAETQEIIERPEKMETRLTACVDMKVDNTIRATSEKKYKSYAQVRAVEPKKASNAPTPRAPSKTMSHMALNIQKSVRSQGYQKTLRDRKLKVLSPGSNGELKTQWNGRDVPLNRITTTQEISGNSFLI